MGDAERAKSCRAIWQQRPWADASGGGELCHMPALSYFKYGAKGFVKRLMRTFRSMSVLIGGLMLAILVCLGHFFPLGFSLSPTDTVSYRLEHLLSHSVVDLFDLVIL
jgi:hypothetical protein